MQLVLTPLIPTGGNITEDREGKSMLLGLALLYVGAVLFLNGLWLMGLLG